MRGTKSYKKILGLTKRPWQKFYTEILSQYKKIPAVDRKTNTLFLTTHYKSYVRLPIVHLELPDDSLRGDITHALISRISLKPKMTSSLALSTLSTILYFGAGMNRKREGEKRFYPSAGARYPIEVYLLVNNVSGLKSALYHYYIKEHALECLSTIEPDTFDDVFVYEWVKDAPVVFILTAVFNRSIMKYNNRGYNYIFIEAGHIAQNLLLLGNLSNASSCPIGGFNEQKLNAILDIHDDEESAIYCVAMGGL